MPDPGVVPQGTKCKHGNKHYCGYCKAESSPKCPHGKHSFCGLCVRDYGVPLRLHS